MSFVDLRAKGFTVSVGGLDCTDLAVGLELRSNQALLDYSGLLSFSGQLDLGGFPLGGFSESLNPRDNPARWAPGVGVAISVVYESGAVPLPIQLKILRSPAPPYPGSPLLQIPVGDDLALLDYRQPEGDASGVELGTATTRTAVINSLLAAANALGTLGTAIAEYPVTAPAQKLDQGGYIRQAGGFAAAVGRVIYEVLGGDFIAPKITLSPTPFKVFSVGTNEGDFFPVEGDVPPSAFVVRGTASEAEAIIANPTPTTSEIRDPDDGNALVQDNRLSITGRGTAVFAVEDRRREQAQLIFEDLEGDKSMRVSRTETKTLGYSVLEENRGRLLTETVSIEEPRGVTQPSSFPNDFTTREASRLHKQYFYNDDFVVVRIETEVQEQNGVINNVGVLASNTVRTQLRTSERITERWEDLGGGNWLYTATGRSFGDNRERRRTSATQPGVKPPATQYKEPQFTIDSQDVEGVASFTPLAGDEYRGQAQPLRFPPETLISAAQANEIAALYGALAQGARWPVRWVAELSSDWLANWNPLPRLDFITGETRRAYLAHGISIQLLPDQAAIAGEAIELGTVISGSIVPPYTLLS